MKLSEAIRLGAMLRPQCRGSLRKEIRTGLFGLFGKKEHASCALGAAFEAGKCAEIHAIAEVSSPGFRGSVIPAGSKYIEVQSPDEWNHLFNVHATCPECGKVEPLKRVIAHLNDDHRLTREQIADWVATIERQTEATETQPTESYSVPC